MKTFLAQSQKSIKSSQIQLTTTSQRKTGPNYQLGKLLGMISLLGQDFYICGPNCWCDHYHLAKTICLVSDLALWGILPPHLWVTWIHGSYPTVLSTPSVVDDIRGQRG